MKRNMPQDIVPAKRSIRDVPLPDRAAERAASREAVSAGTERRAPNRMGDIVVPTHSVHSAPPVPPTTREYNFDYDIDRPKKKSRTGLFVLLGLFILALAFGIVTFFSSAHVTVTPKTETVPADVTLSASKDQAAGQFGYQIVSVSATAQKQVTATSQQQVSIKATGSIIVYNTSSTVQKLVATTRFATTNGLIYRAVSAVSVPPATVVNGQSTPGSVVVPVIADQPGDTYNIGLSDFTLPGLKNTPQFKNIYGRSQTPMSGGFVGMQSKVSDADQLQASTDIDASLKTSLQSQITSQLPSNFILYPQSISYDIGPVSQNAPSSAATAGTTGDPTNSAVLTKTATAQAVIFDRALLSQAILQNLAGATQSSSSPASTAPDATVTNLDTLVFTLKQPVVLSKSYTGQISFELTGDVHAVWNFDAAALKSDLLGLNKSNLDALLQAKYPAVESASASVFPIWKQSFPSDPAKITITTVKS